MIIELIKHRRSIREYTAAEISDDLIKQIVEAGAWAPSGLNNQPWRFVIVRAAVVKEKLAKLTHYGEIILNASVVIPVFLNNAVSYNRTKDTQAMGACIQNMLLAIHGLGLGGVWLGEILKSKEEVRVLLDLPKELELMAVVAMGYPKHTNQTSNREPIEKLIVKWIE